MQTKTWKKERDLLEEAYGSINETDHSTLRAAQTDEENEEDDRKARGLKSQGKQMEEDLKEEEIDPKAAVESAHELPDSGNYDEIPEAPLEPEVERLIKKILNPPSEEELIARAHEGRLSEYIDILVAAKEEAQKEADFRKPKEIES